MTTINLDLMLFDAAPRWLEFAPGGPAVYLTPLDWTDYETARRLSLHPERPDVVDLKTMFRHLVRLSQPTDWKGFERGGQPIPFDRDLLLNLLCSNVQLGVVFDRVLGQWAVNQKIREETEAKNSDAGRVTPSTPPGRPKKTKETAQESDSASNA